METLVTVGAEPAVLSFIMESIVRCLDDEGRAVLGRACNICTATIDKIEQQGELPEEDDN